MSSANALFLDQSKILLFNKGLNTIQSINWSKILLFDSNQSRYVLYCKYTFIQKNLIHLPGGAGVGLINGAGVVCVPGTGVWLGFGAGVGMPLGKGVGLMKSQYGFLQQASLGSCINTHCEGTVG